MWKNGPQFQGIWSLAYFVKDWSWRHYYYTCTTPILSWTFCLKIHSLCWTYLGTVNAIFNFRAYHYLFEYNGLCNKFIGDRKSKQITTKFLQNQGMNCLVYNLQYNIIFNSKYYQTFNMWNNAHSIHNINILLLYADVLE